MPYKATAETTDAETTASVTLRDVPYLRRALVNAVYDMTHMHNWVIDPAADPETVRDYANEVFESLEFNPAPPAPTQFVIGAITTAQAQTVTIQGLRSAAGAFTIHWGDIYQDSYPAGYTGSPVHQYASAGVYRITVSIPPAAVSYFVAIDPKLIIPIGLIGTFVNLTVLQFDSTPYAFVAASETVNLKKLVYLYVRNAAGVGRLQGLSDNPNLSYVRINNAYTAPQVDELLRNLWQQSYYKTTNGGTIHVAGSNAAPTGTYVSQCPPVNGLQYRYQLLNDTCGTFLDPARRWAEVTVN